ncbi:hypothetical protein [Pseudobacteroides cellulosolvens]|uniref:Uncharacterized protein n=1 Tax=Pseudobacteroides cellulosolvens ATCC 35603 = DSM 2933 TaxID=398512 RepID=A0A0L6JX47_9FIRM|nr:hypothetical protein [Pseudobacteroides cellulosolvens]KNY30170.1 hypothetical protein Bccel_5447 [Pseudobacteroides cellulosolvens ATCC 35603 = DSM 2933]
MAEKNWKNISLKGKLESYCNGFGQPVPININELLKGKTTFEENASPYEKYLVGISFDIVVHNKDLSKEIIVGSIHGKYYDIEKCEKDDADIDEAFNDIDQYTFDIYNLPSDLEGDEVSIISDNIFSIDSLYIEPEYRNNRYGTCAMLLLPNALETQFNRNVGYLITEPRPIYDPQKEDKNSNGECVFLEKKLIRFWEALGFKNKDSLFYFNADYDMQKVYLSNKNIK